LLQISNDNLMQAPDEMALHKQVADLTIAVARPLICFNTREEWPKRLYGGTCFILRF
jgi:hypothetical protein